MRRILLALSILVMGCAPANPGSVEIRVMKHGALEWNGAKISLEDARKRLEEFYRLPIQRQPELRIRRDEGAPYADVAGIMAAASRSGAVKIVIIGGVSE